MKSAQGQRNVMLLSSLISGDKITAMTATQILMKAEEIYKQTSKSFAKDDDLTIDFQGTSLEKALE